MQETPFVSIIVAARNEAHQLARCLEALLCLKYPSARLEILLGDDRSEDETWEVMQAYVQKHKQIKAYPIPDSPKGLKGKANVLDFLCSKAKGTFYFFTDADIKVPSQWVETLLRAFQDPKTGMVNGFTLIEGKALWPSLLAADWLMALSAIKTLSDRKIVLTAMGNNMAVRAKAYKETGGYAALPFSLTEDFALLHLFVRKSWRFRIIRHKEATAYSTPVEDWKTFFEQRKRWMSGALRLPWIFKFMLLAQALYPLLFSFIFLTSPLFGLLAEVLLNIATAFYLRFQASRVAYKLSWSAAFVYRFFLVGTSFASLLYYVFGTKSQSWKGRKYA